MLDFGAFIAPLLFVAFSGLVLLGSRLRDGTIRFHQLVLLHFVMTVGMLGGIKLYPYSDVGGNLQLIVYLGAYVVFFVDHDLMRRYRRRREAVSSAVIPASTSITAESPT